MQKDAWGWGVLFKAEWQEQQYSVLPMVPVLFFFSTNVLVDAGLAKELAGRQSFPSLARSPPQTLGSSTHYRSTGEQQQLHCSPLSTLSVQYCQVRNIIGCHCETDDPYERTLGRGKSLGCNAGTLGEELPTWQNIWGIFSIKNRFFILHYISIPPFFHHGTQKKKSM